VNDAQLFSREQKPALSRLNEAERRVLWLLAEGHTAKSIAAELGTTTSAVNERLREARRKTGVGSSRELARRFKAQEIRHEQIGVGKRRPFDAALAPTDAEPWRPQTGVFAMVALFLVAAVGAAALMTQQPSATGNAPAINASGSPVEDPLFTSIFAEQDPTKLFTSPPKTKKDFDREVAGEGYRAMLRQFHGKVHSEPRDPAWAARIESSLRAAFISIPNVGVKGTELRVLCASSLCEIAGTLETPGRAKAAIDTFNRATMYRLNPKALEPNTDKLGLKSTVASIGTMPGGRMSYVFYYSRAK
jgi:DNA-binding CsgD family transcriptional regulator